MGSKQGGDVRDRWDPGKARGKHKGNMSTMQREAGFWILGEGASQPPAAQKAGGSNLPMTSWWVIKDPTSLKNSCQS